MSSADRSQFVSLMTEDLFERSANLIDVDPTIVRQSIEWYSGDFLSVQSGNPFCN